MAAPPAPSPEEVVLRPSAELADVNALRASYLAMQERKGSDNLSWIYWGEYHGFNRYQCWHHSEVGPPPAHKFPYDLFLPWHRAYLHYFEHVVRDRNEKAILPWWDWTSDLSHEEGIPKAFKAAEVGGKRNPLASGPMPEIPEEEAKWTSREEQPPEYLPHLNEPTEDPDFEQPLPAVETVLALESYEDFSGQLQNLHDAVHAWCRGQMGIIKTAAFDPVFYAHHTMIDRLWYQWQLKHGVANIPPGYAGRPLEPFGLTVEQVLDVRSLGYDYASSSAGGEPAAKGA